MVSGIGFLGAGLIFKEGRSVRGLNTAATLWCSAAVGVLAGAGLAAHAALVAGLVVFVNLCLCPLTRFVQAQPALTTELSSRYTINAVCRSDAEAHPSSAAAIDDGRRTTFHELNSHNIDGTDRVEVCATIAAEEREDTSLEQIVGRISLEPQVTAARWRHEAAVA